MQFQYLSKMTDSCGQVKFALLVPVFVGTILFLILMIYHDSKKSSLDLEMNKDYQQRVTMARKESRQVAESEIQKQKLRSKEFEDLAKSTGK